MINDRCWAEASLSDSQFIPSQSCPRHSVSLGNWRSRGGGHDALRRSRGGGLDSLGWHCLGWNWCSRHASQARSSRLIQISMRRSGRCIFREWAAGCSRQAVPSTGLSTRRRMSCISKRKLIMRRGGGVQIDEEPHVERVPISYKKNRPRKIKQYWYCVGCEVRMGSATKKNCSIRTCKRTCCTECLAIDPVLQRNFSGAAGSVRIASQRAIVLGPRSSTSERPYQWVTVLNSRHGP